MQKEINISRTRMIIYRIGFVIGLMALLMIGTLKMLERAGEPLREGVQSYLAQITHSRVYVTTLKDPTFFPDVHLTLENVVFTDIEEANKKLAEAEKIEFSMPFINLLIGRQAFEMLRIYNLVIEKDVAVPEKIMIESVDIEPGTLPALRLKGQRGTTPLEAHINLLARGGQPPSYTLQDHADIGVRVGGLTLGGTLDSNDTDIRLIDARLTHEGGDSYGPQSFFIVKNQEFVKDNPVSCLLEESADLKLTPSHPCATLFKPNNSIEDQQ